MTSTIDVPQPLQSLRSRHPLSLKSDLVNRDLWGQRLSPRGRVSDVASVRVVKVTELIPRQARHGLSPRQIERIDKLIERHLSRGITVAELAAHVFLSRSHFCRTFKQCTGFSPLDYVVRKRIERTQMLMLTTRDSLIHISAQCGFSDQPHLCRTFRRVVGHTPGAWRRAQIETVASG